MPKPLVYWQLDVQNDYVHTSPSCPDIVNAKNVRCGTVEDAQKTGHNRACPLCGVVEKSKKDMVEKSTAHIWVFLTVIIMGNLLWIVGTSSNQDNYNKGYDAGYDAGYKEGQKTLGNPEDTSKPVPTIKPTPIATPIVAKTHGSFKVTATANMIYNNHVGNDWGYYFEAGNQQLPATVNCCVGDDVTLYAEITEDDSVPDVGLWDGYVTIEDGDFEDGFTVTEDVYVYETSGRYSGNEAKFEVTWDFEPQ